MWCFVVLCAGICMKCFGEFYLQVFVCGAFVCFSQSLVCVREVLHLSPVDMIHIVYRTTICLQHDHIYNLQ